MKIQVRNQIVGIINGGAFTAIGDGSWDGALSYGRLVFDRPLVNATPMMCSTWHCNNHRVLAPWEDGSENPFAKMLNAGARLTVRSQALYPSYEGEIECVATITRPSIGIQVVEQSRIGFYSGPSNIVRQEGYTQIYRHAGPGRADGEYQRWLWTDDGIRILAKYEEELFFPIYADFEPFVVHFDVRQATYANNVFEITLSPRAEPLSVYEAKQQVVAEVVRA